MKSSTSSLHIQLAEILHEVVGERIVIVYDQNHCGLKLPCLRPLEIRKSPVADYCKIVLSLASRAANIRIRLGVEFRNPNSALRT